MTASSNLTEEYVRRHNLGVVSGDFSEMLELFADDAVLEFRGSVRMMLEGKKAIEQAFARLPPTTEILLHGETSGDGDATTIRYKSADAHKQGEGSITVTKLHGRIKLMTVFVA